MKGNQYKARQEYAFRLNLSDQKDSDSIDSDIGADQQKVQYMY